MRKWANEDDVLAVLDKLDEETTRTVVRLLIDSMGYLDQHNPDGDEQYGVYPCSGKTYHYCTMSSRHSEECVAGKPTRHKGDTYDYTVEPCPVPCEEGEPMPWCQCSGHDCPDCKVVVALTAIVEAVPE